MVTRRPRDSRMAAREAAAMPLPREETTPPVTNTYLVIVLHARLDGQEREIWIIAGSDGLGTMKKPFAGGLLHQRKQALPHLAVVIVEPRSFGRRQGIDGDAARVDRA